MNQIRNYSSNFATKINYVLDQIGTVEIQSGRIQAIVDIVNEKWSTVVNWLFNGRLPKRVKRLSIADAIGVSYEYLYNDNIGIESICKPEVYYEDDDKYYLIPFIEEEKIFDLKSKKIFPITKRIPIIFPNFDELVKKYGSNLYVTNIKNFDLGLAYDSNIIYSEKVVFDTFKLVIHNDVLQNQVVIKKMIDKNGTVFLESVDSQNRVVKEKLNKSADFLSILSIILTL